MKGINLIMLGVIFLMSLSVVSAYDWLQYGNSYAPLHQKSYGGWVGRFQNPVYIISIPNGYSVGSPVSQSNYYQPLISQFNSSLLIGEYQQYVVFPNGNYLQIYDKNLNLLQEIYANPSISQISIIDFNQDSIADEIAGIFKLDNTTYTFNIFSFNVSSQTFNQTFQQNFSVINGTTIAGVRCGGSKCYFLLTLSGTNATFVKIDKTATTSYILNANSTYTEPLSWYDMNGDNLLEFLTYSSSEFILFNENGNMILKQTFPLTMNGFGLLNAKMFSPDLTSSWKIVTLSVEEFAPTFFIKVYKLDGSVVWSKVVLQGSGGYELIVKPTGKIAIADFDGDYLGDVYFACFGKIVAWEGNSYGILKSTNGNSLYSFSSVGAIESLTLADMNGNGVYDFIGRSRYFEIIQPPNATKLYADGFLVPSGLACVPADLDLNGYLDVICSSSGITKVYFSNYTNQNVHIQSVTYDTGTIIQIGSILYMYITIFDVENNPASCSVDCFGNHTWTIEDGTTLSCSYNNLGQFNNTIRCRDNYHSTYDYFSQIITVTTTGIICGNAICEAGENNVNCPADCPSNVTTTQATDTGGMPLPTKIVDLDNTEQGLLPEIYYGLLGFLSNTLTPMIILIFAIFFVMIMLALAFIVKRVAHRVGDLAR